MKRKVKLCCGCVESLNDIFPYLYPDKTPMKQEDLIVEEVPIDDCDNMECNLDREPVWLDID